MSPTDWYYLSYFAIGFLVTCVCYRYLLRSMADSGALDGEAFAGLIMLFMILVIIWPVLILIGIFMFIVSFEFGGKKDG